MSAINSDFDETAQRNMAGQYGGGVKFYSKWVKSYDKDTAALVYNGPAIVASMLAKFVHDKDARILDVAAGTGLVGLQAKSLGYTNMDALDGSTDMLDIARSLDIYKNFYCTSITTDPTPGIEDCSYDAVVICGGFFESAIPNEALVELLRIVKTGCYVIFVIFEEEVAKRMEDVVNNLQENGKKCKLCHKTTRENYLMNKSCEEFVIQVL